MDNAEDTNITNLNLFRMFKKYDRNLNGVLEITEYIDCMKAQDEDFSEQEIVSLALMADINGDNSIDYEEFMKHFVDMLKRIRFMTVIQQALSSPDVEKKEVPIEQLEKEEQAAAEKRKAAEVKEGDEASRKPAEAVEAN